MRNNSSLFSSFSKIENIFLSKLFKMSKVLFSSSSDNLPNSFMFSCLKKPSTFGKYSELYDSKNIFIKNEKAYL